MKHDKFKADCIRQRYAHGVLTLRADLAHRHEVEQFITRSEFLQVADAQHVPTRKRRYRMYMFRLPLGEVETVMKVGWNDPAYQVRRRLAIDLAQLYRDRSERAFFGALMLRRAGIPTFDPLACWTREPTSGPRESYLLYEKIAAIGSVQDLKDRGGTGKQLSPILDQVACLARQLHEQRLLHNDRCCRISWSPDPRGSGQRRMTH